jgi:glycerol kinase
VLAATGGEIRRHGGLLTAVLASTPSQRRFQIEGSVQSAGSAVDWACRLTGIALAALPVEPLDAESLPVVVPALVGLGAPWWRPRARATVFDLDPQAGGAALVRGTLVGVAQRIADNVEAMREANVAVGTLRVSGALAGRLDFAQALAELAGCDLQVSGEETGLGGLARWLAEVLAGGSELEPPVALARLSPSWPRARRAAARRRWLEAIDRVV